MKQKFIVEIESPIGINAETLEEALKRCSNIRMDISVAIQEVEASIKLKDESVKKMFRRF